MGWDTSSRRADTLQRHHDVSGGYILMGDKYERDTGTQCSQLFKAELLSAGVPVMGN